MEFQGSETICSKDWSIIEWYHLFTSTLMKLVYSKMCQIIWKNSELCNSIVMYWVVSSTTCQSKTYLYKFQLYWYYRMAYQRKSNTVALGSLSVTNNGRTSLLQMHTFTQRMFQWTGLTPIWKSERLAIFFKVLEKFKT